MSNLRVGQHETNILLAKAIREISAKHEASYNPEAYQMRSMNYGTGERDGPLQWYGGYTKTYDDCIQQVVGDDPIAMILACLFTAGYSEVYDFCDQVLGPMKPEWSGHPDPDDPDNYWIDDATGERRKAP